MLNPPILLSRCVNKGRRKIYCIADRRNENLTAWTRQKCYVLYDKYPPSCIFWWRLKEKAERTKEYKIYKTQRTRSKHSSPVSKRIGEKVRINEEKKDKKQKRRYGRRQNNEPKPSIGPMFATRVYFYISLCLFLFLCRSIGLSLTFANCFASSGSLPSRCPMQTGYRWREVDGGIMGVDGSIFFGTVRHHARPLSFSLSFSLCSIADVEIVYQLRWLPWTKPRK